MTVDLPTKSTEKTPKEHRWPPRQGEWTYNDYARLPDNGMRYEVIEGDLYMSPAPRPKHQLVSGKLVYAFHQFLREYELGQVYHAPIDVNMPGLISPVQPDLLFIAHKNMDIWVTLMQTMKFSQSCYRISSYRSMRFVQHNFR